MREVTVDFASQTQRAAIETAVRDRIDSIDDTTRELAVLSLIAQQFAYVRETEPSDGAHLSLTFIFEDAVQYDRAHELFKEADDPNLKWLGYRFETVDTSTTSRPRVS